MFTDEDVVRFWSKVNKTGSCWHWTRYQDAAGYGIFRFQGKVHKAHRIALRLSGIEIPAGKEVDHRCHNRGCVNPDHLRLVTRSQNIQNLSGAHQDNPTGVRGVSWNKARQKYMARVGINGQRLYLGLFDTIAEADAAATAKRNEIYTHNDLDRVKV